MALTARILRLAYQLRIHCLGEWALDRWFVAVTLGGAAAILGLWLLRGSPAVGSGRWLALALLILAGVGLLGLGQWAARRGYVVFTPQAETFPPATWPAGRPLDPRDKVLLRATGRFEVGGKSAFFADLLAYWRTFASREHAVMAFAHTSRFLGVGNRPERDVGMWYIFFRPEAVESITPGRLIFGAAKRQALCVRYRSAPAAGGGSPQRLPRLLRFRAQPAVATVYLAFDDGNAFRQVWADLRADGREAWPMAGGG
jgi:hypothetical protein